MSIPHNPDWLADLEAVLAENPEARRIWDALAPDMAAEAIQLLADLGGALTELVAEAAQAAVQKGTPGPPSAN